MVELDGHLASHDQAALALRLLLRMKITGRMVSSGRLSAEVGNERADRRDADVLKRRRRQLQPRTKGVPEVVAAEVDGARVRTRAPGSGPGVHAFRHKEDKVGCLVSLKSQTHESDPRPEVPATFRDARRVRRLVQQIKGTTAAPDDSADPAGPADDAPAVPASADPAGPKQLVRTCVASRERS